MENTELKSALDRCQMFVDRGANIQVVDGEMGNITFHSYDTSSIEYLIDQVRKDQLELEIIHKSDASKEKSSMDYYNVYKEYQEKCEYLYDVIDEMARYIADISDCPLDRFDKDLDCEIACGNVSEEECWKNYFKGKVSEKRYGK